MCKTTMRKAYLSALLSLAVVFSVLASMAASTPALAVETLAISPTTGVMNTATTITVTGGGFVPDASGYVWFDTDDDSIVDPSEPQLWVTVTGSGDIPTGTSLETPLLPPNKSYWVRADIPSGTPVEASAFFKTSVTTTGLTVTKYDAYGVVIGGPETVTYQWMEANLPVQGDGVTPYYCQGPTFDNTSFDTVWNPEENVNVSSRFYGAAKGTDVKDLANLVGGAAPGDTIKIKASDNFSKWFDYETIYNPAPRQGKLVVAWYNDDFGGYVPSYDTGMRLLFFADDSTNPWGWHAFGNWDMHETMPESRWHYYSATWPSSSGLSVQVVYNIDIYQPNLISTDAAGNAKESFSTGETVYVKGLGMAKNSSYSLWVQPEPVSNNKLIIIDGQDPIPPSAYVLNSADDPSGAQETVVTDANGDFGPVAIWTIGSLPAVLKYDIVADSQTSGTAGEYDTYTAGSTSPKDFIDSPGFEGFAVTEAPTATPTPGGVGGIAELPDQSALSAHQPDSSAPQHVLLAGGAAAALLALIAGGWYAKRRLS
jgi:hypothetical protein